MALSGPSQGSLGVLLGPPWVHLGHVQIDLVDLIDQIDLVVLIDLKSPIDLIDLRDLVDQREQTA